MKKLFILIIFLFSVTLGHANDEICPLNGVPLKAKGIKSLHIFQHVPILENGRLKPLDTYARNILLRFSGKQSFQKEKAIAWLARLLFSPGETQNDKIFLINNPEIATTLGIKEDKHRRYSFAEIQPTFKKLSELYALAQKLNPKDRDIVENEIIRVYENVKLYSGLSTVFSFAFPHPDFTLNDSDIATQLGLSDSVTQFSFLDMVLRAQKLHSITAPLENISQDSWTPGQTELVSIVAHLFDWTHSYHDLPLTIIPSYIKDDAAWYSPWDALPDGIQMQEGRDELTYLGTIMAAYWNGKQLDFDLAGKNLIHSVEARIKTKPKMPSNLSIEVVFNNVQPFLWERTIYFLVFILYLINLSVSNPRLQRFCFVLLLTGFALHIFGMACRISILQRPPVSNLYETFIFVSAVSVLASIIIELVNKRGLGVVIGSLAGYIFLTIASKFSADGDTLQMLVAVLNSNFWLATHVTSITAGYAGTCVAGIVGHIYLLQVIFKSKDKALLDSTYKTLLGTLGFGLTMTFLGTNLGGIWADQSWGRFWGWDPKENGALLIILWTALLFHLKIGKMIGPLELAVGSILGIVVVMWAWFGVNLLSIGLHSYGFTSGLMVNLIIYVTLQLVFIGIVYPWARGKTNEIK
jgi:ABC-type transport system involved in cytochrome c biogenesis permease subunit